MCVCHVETIKLTYLLTYNKLGPSQISIEDRLDPNINISICFSGGARVSGAPEHRSLHYIHYILFESDSRPTER